MLSAHMCLSAKQPPSLHERPHSRIEGRSACHTRPHPAQECGTCSSTLATGSIQVVMGPMFSGKTTEMMWRVRRHQVARRRCLVVKYAKDMRYSDDQDVLITHDRQQTPAVAVTRLRDAWAQAVEAEVVGVDEGQFYPDLAEFCEDLANLGKTVIVACLDGTYQRKPFPSVSEMLPLAESVIKLKAVCMVCFGEAEFSKRLVADSQVELIGGADKYTSVCRRCYFHESKPEVPSVAMATGSENDSRVGGKGAALVNKGRILQAIQTNVTA